MADMQIRLGPFPDELWDVSKPQDFDKWFIDAWSKSDAINAPKFSDLEAKAVVLSRATVRQAWWSASESQKAYIRKPTFDGYKSVLSKTKISKSRLDDLIAFLQFRKERPDIQESQTHSLTRNVFFWLEASALDDDGVWMTNDFESCSKFASALMETRKFLHALEQQANKQIERHRDSIKNIGKPELVAFALPFVEAGIFMSGAKPSSGNRELSNALMYAWEGIKAPERNGWES